MNKPFSQKFTKLKMAPVKGLILAGGESSRMGKDKAQINYHGMPQIEYLKHQFNLLGLDTFISCKSSQYPEEEKKIEDKMEGLGPFGAILSALEADSQVAWLVVACDLPYIQADDLAELLNNRNPETIATAYLNRETNFPDPLCAIWEPTSYQRMQHFLSKRYFSPRAVLINSNCQILEPRDAAILRNINTPEDRLHIEQTIAKS